MNLFEWHNHQHFFHSIEISRIRYHIPSANVKGISYMCWTVHFRIPRCKNLKLELLTNNWMYVIILASALYCHVCSTDTSGGAFCNDPFDVNLIPPESRKWSYALCAAPTDYVLQNGGKAVCQKVKDRGKFTFNIFLFHQYKSYHWFTFQLAIELSFDEDVLLHHRIKLKIRAKTSKYLNRSNENSVKFVIPMDVMAQHNLDQLLCLSFFRQP